MKVIIFNDLHLDDDKSESFSRFSSFLESIKHECEWEEKILILVPGDITQSGYKSQFKEFEKMILEFENHYSGRVDFVFSPGNHDNGFINNKVEKKHRQFVESIASKQDLKISDFVNKIEVQNNYNDSTDRIIKHNFGYVNKISDFMCNYVVYSEGKSICINSFNTAATALKQDSRDLIMFPNDGFDNKFNKEEYNIVISMFHYPFNWHRRMKHTYFENYIKKNSDIILIGHEHVGELKNEKNLLTGEGLLSYLSPALYDKETSKYTIMDMDLHNHKILISNYTYNEKLSGFQLINEIPLELADIYDKRHINNKSFSLSKETRNTLSDYGVQITHPKLSNISFNELYVYPQFRVLSKYNEDYSELLTDCSALTDSIEIKNNMNRILIIGESDFGKTSLLKYYYNSLFDLNYVPLLLDLDRVTGLSTLDRFIRYIDKCFKEQYSDDQLVRYNQLESKRKFLLVDNIDKFSGNISVLLSLINKYLDKYPNIMITTSDPYIFDLFSKNEEISDKDDFIDVFDSYTILEFRHYLRERLINKWVQLGEENIEIKKRIERVTKFQRIIDNLVKQHLLKPLPLYLVIIMQASDMGRKLDGRFSSRPHFYNYLIIDAYSKLPFDNYEINEFEKYLVNLSYFITKKNFTLTDEEFNSYHNDYIKINKISSNNEKIYYIESLKKYAKDIKILKIKNGVYSFNHPYHYCFYLSKYLVNYRNTGSEDMLLDMIENIHIEMNANTLNFVIYHSNDDLVYSLIKDKTASLFKDEMEFKMEKDIKNINNLYKKYNPYDGREIKYITDIDKAREENNRKIDEMTVELDGLEKEKEKEIAVVEDEQEEIRDFTFINTMNTGIRTLEVMGGIIKHGIGVFNGDEKTKITNDTITLGLKLITFFLSRVQGIIDHIYVDIKNKLDGDEEDKEILEKFKIFMYKILSTSIHSLLTKVADTIANTKDDIIFHEVLVEKGTVASKFIEFVIEIFFFGKLDFKKMEDYLKENVSNSIATASLINLVGAYNQRFQMSRKDLQRFNSMLKKFKISLDKSQSRMILDNADDTYKL